MRERISDQCEPSVATDSGAINSGISCAAANMNDRSLAVWPDGNDDVLRWVLSSRAPSGRGRRKTSLKGNCTTAAAAEHVMPRSTARRPRGPVSDSAPAMTAHVPGWRNTSPARLGSARPRRDPVPTRRHSMRSSRRHDLPITKPLGSSRSARASAWSARGNGPRTGGKEGRRVAARGRPCRYRFEVAAARQSHCTSTDRTPEQAQREHRHARHRGATAAGGSATAATGAAA